MRKAVFLDRDGVINVEVDYLHRPEDVVLIDGLPEAIVSAGILSPDPGGVIVRNGAPPQPPLGSAGFTQTFRFFPETGLIFRFAEIYCKTGRPVCRHSRNNPQKHGGIRK